MNVYKHLRDGQRIYNKNQLDIFLLNKVNQHNCNVTWEYIPGGGIGGGNAFLIKLDDYVKINIGQLSNDYTVWRPPVNINISVKNPSTGEWSDWKAMCYTYPFL